LATECAGRRLSGREEEKRQKKKMKKKKAKKKTSDEAPRQDTYVRGTWPSATMYVKRKEKDACAPDAPPRNSKSQARKKD
jgi:5,10-methylene-tetrahydrofolate dehydrogenase/methenyl tetrahydrofolate cyclohydrolase